MSIDQVAKRVLYQLDKDTASSDPPAYLVILDWRAQHYVGSLQHFLPIYPEVVLLSKTSSPMPTSLKDALVRARPALVYVSAKDMLDLEDRTHVLRRLGNQLFPLTGEQTDYMDTHPLNIEESNTGEKKDGKQRHLYEGGVEIKPGEN